MRTVLVTGAGGFIGSHLCELLVSHGWDVRALVRYTSHDQAGALVHVDPEVRSSIDIVTGDLRDPSAVRRAMEGAQVVLHLGAVIAIPYSYRNPAEVVETNVLGTLAVLDAARDLGVERVVHTSTSEVYGTAVTDAITEAHPLQGQSPYSASKIGADKIAESYWRSFETPVVTLRPFNTYGPRQSPRAVIPTILMQALKGSEVRLGSLAPTRDFTYVTDTAAAFELAALAEGVEGEVIHLGTGREVSIGDVVAIAEQVLGKHLDVVQEDVRLRPERSEVMRLLSDPSHALERLGWEPQVSLEQGIERTAEWLKVSADWFALGGYAV
ncbi:MAG: SDR family NAD(P)-dependent oxidoreductase [Acidimicrobiales bacterium]